MDGALRRLMWMHQTEWIVGRQIRGRKITWGGEMMNQCTRERIARKGKNMSEKPYEEAL